MADSKKPWKRRRIGFVAVALLTVCAILIAAPRSASALPSICDSYPNLPQCIDAAGGSGNNGPESGVEATNSGGSNSGGGPNGTAGPGASATGPTATALGPGASAGNSAGSLPFTGYPLSGLVLLLLALLVAGLAVRACVALCERLGSSSRL